MEAPEEDLDAILNSTLEDMEKAEKQMPPPTPASVPATPTTTPTARPSSSTSAKTIEAFTEQLSNLMLDMSKENQDPEKLLKEIMKQLEAPEASSTPDVSSSSAVPDPVQANLMRTIASLAESAQKLASTDPAQSEALLKQMMDQFEQDPGLQGLMEGMLQQLLAKDLLYAPMKELRDKYVIFLERHQATIPAAEAEKYRKQLEYIKQICVVYENDEKNTQKIAMLMQEMQEYGQPPPELLKEVSGDETGENPLQGLLSGPDAKNANQNCLLM